MSERKTIANLKLWLEISKCTLSNTFIGTTPTIADVKGMLAEVEQLEAGNKMLKERIYQYEEAEAMCCPEDVGPKEFIGQQQKQIKAKDEALDGIIYRLRQIRDSTILKQRMTQRAKWINATLEIAKQALGQKMTKGLGDKMSV